MTLKNFLPLTLLALTACATNVTESTTNPNPLGDNEYVYVWSFVFDELQQHTKETRAEALKANTAHQEMLKKISQGEILKPITAGISEWELSNLLHIFCTNKPTCAKLELYTKNGKLLATAHSTDDLIIPDPIYQDFVEGKLTKPQPYGKYTLHPIYDHNNSGTYTKQTDTDRLIGFVVF